MDLGNLVSIYGKPTIRECPFCNGEGCSQCLNFGFIAQPGNKGIAYSFKYPIYIELKKRDSISLIRNALLIGISLLAIIAIIISYHINF